MLDRAGAAAVTLAHAMEAVDPNEEPRIKTIGTLTGLFPGWPNTTRIKHQLVSLGGLVVAVGPAGSVAIHDPASGTGLGTMASPGSDPGDPVGVCRDGRYLITAFDKAVFVSDLDPSPSPQREVYRAARGHQLVGGPFRWTTAVVVIERDGHGVCHWVAVEIAPEREPSPKTLLQRTGPVTHAVQFEPAGIVWRDPGGLHLWGSKDEDRPRVIAERETLAEYELASHAQGDAIAADPRSTRIVLRGPHLCISEKGEHPSERTLVHAADYRLPAPSFSVPRVRLEAATRWELVVAAEGPRYLVSGPVATTLVDPEGNPVAPVAPLQQGHARPLVLGCWCILSGKQDNKNEGLVALAPERPMKWLGRTGTIGPNLCWHPYSIYMIRVPENNDVPRLQRIDFDHFAEETTTP